MPTIRHMAADNGWGPRSLTPTYLALPIRDKWHVMRSLRRGEAPRDPQTAAAAVELAEVYQRQGRSRWRPGRRYALFVAVACGAAAILFATGGELAQALFLAAAALTNLAALAVSPRLRPDMVARSLEASKAVVGSDP